MFYIFSHTSFFSSPIHLTRFLCKRTEVKLVGVYCLFGFCGVFVGVILFWGFLGGIFFFFLSRKLDADLGLFL